MKPYSSHILLIALCSMPLYVSELHANEPNLLEVSSLFTQMDSDNDGVLKPDEINKQSMLSNEFKSVDSNRDGALDPNEFEIFIAKADI